MNLQTQPLKAISPATMLHGFDIEVIRHDKNLVESQVLAKHFVNRFIEINTRCDGRNSEYPNKLLFTLLITQHTSANSPAGITIGANVGLIILKPYESIEFGQVTELNQFGIRSASLLLQIKDWQNASMFTMVYEVAKAKSCLH